MAAPSKKSLCLFVSKIPWHLARKDLGEYFGRFGSVSSCQIPFSKETGFHKGYGWVTFRTKNGKDSALQKEVHVVDGATVYVEPHRESQRGVMNKSDDDTKQE